MIDYLLGLKIPGHYSTQERGSQVTHEVYASLMGRSKISINLSYSVSCHQLKSRVLEAMLSGALLFESENEQTSKLFVPMKDYVQFSSKEDLAVKIAYYLEHENELKEIRTRKNGHIDHIAFDVADIDTTFAVLKNNGYSIDEPNPIFLAFWERGCKYFNLIGPDGERLEFNQIL